MSRLFLALFSLVRDHSAHRNLLSSLCSHHSPVRVHAQDRLDTLMETDGAHNLAVMCAQTYPTLKFMHHVTRCIQCLAEMTAIAAGQANLDSTWTEWHLIFNVAEGLSNTLCGE